MDSVQDMTRPWWLRAVSSSARLKPEEIACKLQEMLAKTVERDWCPSQIGEIELVRTDDPIDCLIRAAWVRRTGETTTTPRLELMKFEDIRDASEESFRGLFEIHAAALLCSLEVAFDIKKTQWVADLIDVWHSIDCWVPLVAWRCEGDDDPVADVIIVYCEKPTYSFLGATDGYPTGGLPPVLHSELDEPTIIWDSGLSCRAWMGTWLPDWWPSVSGKPSADWLGGRMLRVPEEFVEIAERHPTCPAEILTALVDSVTLDWRRTQVGIVIDVPDGELHVRYSGISVMMSGVVLSLPISALLFCELL